MQEELVTQDFNIVLHIEHDRIFWFGWITNLMHHVAQYLFNEITRGCHTKVRISCKVCTYTPIKKSSFVVFKSPIAFKKRGKEPYDKYKRATVITICVSQYGVCRYAPVRLNLLSLRQFRHHTFIIKRVVVQSRVCLQLLI